MKFLQNLGRSLLGAVAVMPVAALLLGIGYWIDPSGWGESSPIAAFLIKSGGAILDNLGIVFAIAVAFGLSKDQNGAAALSGAIAFMVITTLLSVDTVSQLRGGEAVLATEGFSKINNPFIGILSGIVASAIYNKFYKVKLPSALAFFGGRRLVPILTSIAMMILSLILLFVWPFVYYGLVAFGKLIAGLGPLGAGIFVFLNRLLIPTGLHHALNVVFFFDIAGINDLGNFLGGAAALESGAAIKGVTGMYQSGFFPIMMFGLPAAALAMYHTAKPEQKKVAGSLLLAGAIASVVTGVTEPLEFAFMFSAPVLYIIHSLFAGLAAFIAASFQWTSGFGFSAGLIDFLLSLRNPVANKPYMLLVLGLGFGVLYYFTFRFLIVKFKFLTPGRDEVEKTEESSVKLSSDSEFKSAAEIIIKGLGGKENIEALNHCATRLRVVIKDNQIIDEKQIKKAKVAGVIRPSKTDIQVIVGPKVQFVYDEMKTILEI